MAPPSPFADSRGWPQGSASANHFFFLSVCRRDSKAMDTTSTEAIIQAIASSTDSIVGSIDQLGVAMQLSALIIVALLAALFFGKVWK